MVTLAERFIRNQKEALKDANNARFTVGEWEYKLAYEGGIAESFAIYGRRKGTSDYSYINGFMGFKLFNREQVIAMAKALVAKNSKD